MITGPSGFRGVLVFAIQIDWHKSFISSDIALSCAEQKEIKMRIKSFALTSLLGLSLICVCTAAFGVQHPDGSFATPGNGDSSFVYFKHIDNTGILDSPYGWSNVDSVGCSVTTQTFCQTDCDGVTELGTATLASIPPTSAIAVTSLVFGAVGTFLPDGTSKFCAVLDGAGNVWAIDRDLPAASNITTANSSSRIIPCKTTDIFHSDYGCGTEFPSQIGIEGGFIKLDTTDGNSPFGAHCSETAHNGRMVVDDVSNKLYICTASGWMTTDLTDPSS